jgi:glycosyltransferase involved in cell wall biosynthesis
MTAPSHAGARNGLRFIVLQPGARRHYAVPALLARAGMLERFYTDICAHAGTLRYVAASWPDRMRPKPVARLLGRRLPREIPRHFVRHIPAYAIAERAIRRLPLRNLDRHFEVASRLVQLVRKDGFANATALYTLLINSDLDLVRDAKAAGLRVVHDVMIGPDVGLWIYEEARRYPDSEPELDIDIIHRGRELDAEKYRLADLILVPSPFTAKAVIELGAEPKRVVTVPFGLDEARIQRSIGRPVKGRVLFVGSVGLRKGSPYLAEATRLLRRRGLRIDTRAVGPFDRDLISRSEFCGPTYVGQVPRARIAEEFRRADIFVFPTLCDSFGIVQLEAMAYGIPVITTPHCGSVVRDGIDGFIVPIRDAAAIADKVELLLADRALRERMGQSARERAKEFTWTRYGERLISALGTLAS